MTERIKTGLTRRTLLTNSALALGAATLAGTPRFGRAAEPEVSDIRVTQAVTSLAFIQNYVAQNKGFFADEGLNAEIVVTRGGGPDVQAVLAGDAAFTVNDGAQVLPALAKGRKLTCVLATLERNIINVSMRKETAEAKGVGPDSPIEAKLAALEGLKIGVTRPGALTWQLARYNLAKAGLDPDADATIVGLGGGPAVAVGLERGDVDAIYISVPLGEKVVARGKAITLINNAEGEDPNLPTFMMEGLWAQPSFIADNPGTVGACVRALARASAFVTENPPETVLAALGDTFDAFGPDVMRTGIRMVQAAVSTSGRFDQTTLDYTQGVLEASGTLEQSFEVDRIFDDRFLR